MTTSALARVIGATTLGLVLSGCAGQPSSIRPATVPPSPVTPTVARSNMIETPPTADLAADGGDPVEGGLGSYTWRGDGSDAGWLSGAPISVAVGEPLQVTLDPAVGVETWRARFVPTDQTDADGARSLGEGAEAVAFEAPATGRWTVEVMVTFAGGLGSASYFWELDVD